ncbi:TetR/AcrR family transcriptional regulator [Streptomyces sp. NPDC093252]|uniref:TetR/AcrR family transcriptional regulator n=1 Tax=Streptomyces sp. NPDC093252 TaxID=3154980 RepID=UPI00343EEE79
MPDAVPTKGQRSAAELKAAALRVIARQGYLAAKVAEITAEAGKSAGVFYRYFTDKEDLLRSVADDFTTTLRERIAETSGHAHTLDGADDIRRHVRVYWELCRDHHAEMTGIFEAALVSAEFAGYWERVRDRQVEIWTDHVAEARRLPAPDRETELTALAIVAMVERFCQIAVPVRGGGGSGGVARPGGRGAIGVDEDAAVEALTRLIARGVLVDGVDGEDGVD